MYAWCANYFFLTGVTEKKKQVGWEMAGGLIRVSDDERDRVRISQAPCLLLVSHPLPVATVT